MTPTECDVNTASANTTRKAIRTCKAINVPLLEVEHRSHIFLSSDLRLRRRNWRIAYHHGSTTTFRPPEVPNISSIPDHHCRPPAAQLRNEPPDRYTCWRYTRGLSSSYWYSVAFKVLMTEVCFRSTQKPSNWCWRMDATTPRGSIERSKVLHWPWRAIV